MAIFHCSLKSISRASREGGAKSAVAAAAYRTGALLVDERTGLAFDYRPRGGVIDSFIVLPEGAPPWMADRALLWNAAELAEKRKDARTAREIVIALPHELSADMMNALARDFALWLLKRYGVAVDVALHKPHPGGSILNFHAHVQFTDRAATKSGFGNKLSVLNDWESAKTEIKEIRKAWESLANAALERAGSSSRIDHRSHKERGLELPPQEHVGVNATAMHRKGTKPKGSVVHHDFRGREVDYPAIDHGKTRAEHNAEIVKLQNYRDVAAEQQEKKARSVKPSPAVRALIEQVARMEARLSSMANDIALLEAAIGGAPLPEGFITRIRVMLERAWALIMQRQESEWLQERTRRQQEAEKRQEELEAKAWAFRKAAEELSNLERQRQEIERVQAANRQLERDIYRMGLLLNGMPPYEIKMKVPLAASFNEAAYAVRLQRQSNAELLRALHLPEGRAARGPPPAVVVRQQEAIARNPALATVALRRNVLQTKELLARIKPPEGAEGRGAAARAGPAAARKAG